MKKHLLIIFLFILFVREASAQITDPVTRANFGVDGDLRANYYNGSLAASGDDWFKQAGTGTGTFVIDTTGAAAILKRYATDMAFRRLPFFRTMQYPGFTVVNNRLLLDAVFVRDYHGDDSTVFGAGSSKNGYSPKDWGCPVSQGIPDKNDILDMMVHVRRAGPSLTDSLWMFGGVSLDNTTGNRYFDFEMYQTDIYYDRASRAFYGYGPDAGHTSWEFDAAGNVTKPGDIIFSAEYQNSSLTMLEARIWINRSSLLLNPTAFNWSGKFDGASNGSTYGYASISPETAGAYYTGLQCANNTWGGPFGVILQDETLVTDYIARQFVEFSVNLSKLGLDPVTLLGGSACGMPFRKVLVKTRSSASFTAELKDFVGPFDFFLAPRVNILTETPVICASGGVSEVHVTNPVATSVYEWYTPDGNIISNTTGTSIYVDRPGRYIVRQYLQAGCSEYAADTVEVAALPICDVLASEILNLRGSYSSGQTRLNWTVLNNESIQYFEIQKSSDGRNFSTIDKVYNSGGSSRAEYNYIDENITHGSPAVFYRILMYSAESKVKYSNTIAIGLDDDLRTGIKIFPNPVKTHTQLQINAPYSTKAQVRIADAAGKLIVNMATVVQQGRNVMVIDQLEGQPRGIYMLSVYLDGETYNSKIILTR